MMGKTLTPNQLYGGLNKRFDKRVKVLERLGYVRVRVENNWVVYRRVRNGRTLDIPAAFVMHAMKQVWVDRLVDYK